MGLSDFDPAARDRLSGVIGYRSSIATSALAMA
jgi:hypothetical protein